MNESLGCMLILCFYFTITAVDSEILHEIVEYANGTEGTIQFNNVEALLNKLNFKKCTKDETTKCSLVSFSFGYRIFWKYPFKDGCKNSWMCLW